MGASTAVYLGFFLAVISGLMNGTFTLPMRYLGRWAWENVWSIWVVVSCLIMPPIMFFLTVTNPWQVLSAASRRAEIIASATGFIWGFGAVFFGLGVSAIGISMANTLVLAISATLGSFLPLLILAPDRLFSLQGKAIMLGTAVGLAGICLCGYAGVLRERTEEAGAPRQMVGAARPFWVGLLLCAGGGLISAAFNVGYSLSQGIMATAIQAGNSSFAGSNVIWLLVLGSGSVVQLLYCGTLLTKNRTWSNYRQSKVAAPVGLSMLMGLGWAGSIFVYGAASPNLGKLGPAIGWPLSLVVSIVTANGVGFLTGEWKRCSRSARRWMMGGVVILLVAVGMLGWSGSLAN